MRLKPNKKAKKYSNYRSYWLCVFFLCTGIFIGWKDIPGFLKSNILLLRKLDIVEVFFAKNSLNSLNLNIKFENLEKLRIKREEALKKGY